MKYKYILCACMYVGTDIPTHPYSLMINLYIYHLVYILEIKGDFFFCLGKNTLLFLSWMDEIRNVLGVFFWVYGGLFCLFIFKRKEKKKKSHCLFGFVKIYMLVFIILNVVSQQKEEILLPNSFCIHIRIFINARKMLFAYQCCITALFYFL